MQQSEKGEKLVRKLFKINKCKVNIIPRIVRFARIGFFIPSVIRIEDAG